MQDALTGYHLVGHHQARGKRRFPSYRYIRQRPLRQQNRIGWRQHQGSAVFLENHQTHPVAPLIRIGQQGEYRAFGGRHTLRYRHRPGTIHQKKDQVSGFLNPDFFLVVIRSDREGNFFLFTNFIALFLKRGGSSKSCVKSQVVGFIGRGARLNIPAAFSVCNCFGAPAAMLAYNFVQGSIQGAGFKGLAWFYDGSPIPPTRV